MRLAVALLAVALGGSIASADDAPPASQPAPAPAAVTAPAIAKPASKVALRVVRVMPESRQALLFDRDRGTHVLAEVGQQIDGYRVEEIADDTVTLRATGGAEVVLAAPERSWRRHDEAPVAAKRVASATPDDPYAVPEVAAAVPAPAPAPAPATPADPYAPAPAPAPATVIAPSDPYASGADAATPYDVAPVRVVEAPAPIVPGADGVRTVDAAEPAAPQTLVSPAPVAPTPLVSASAVEPAPSPAASASPAASPSASPSPSPTASPTASPTEASPASDELVLSRLQLADELADFSKLATEIHATFAPGGVRVDSVAAGSLFARAGLRTGDIIAAVDGQPLRSLDDAADLYARASSARNLSITVVRDGKPASLRVTIK
jgi:type II secretory pathway component PulC